MHTNRQLQSVDYTGREAASPAAAKNRGDHVHAAMGACTIYCCDEEVMQAGKQHAGL